MVSTMTIPVAADRPPMKASRASASGSVPGRTLAGSSRSMSARSRSCALASPDSGTAIAGTRSAAASRIASTIFPYPVQRHRLPAIASRIAASVGAVPGPESRNARPAMSIPGVQIPHWTPPVARKAAWIGSSCPSDASPSTVRISLPSTWQTGTRQLSTTSPSTRTEHAPHSPSPQPSFDPVRPRSRRRTSSRRRPPGTATSTARPLTVNRCTGSAVRAGPAGTGAVTRRSLPRPRACAPPRGPGSPRAPGPALPAAR